MPAVTREPRPRCSSVLNSGGARNTSGSQPRSMPVTCGLCASWSLQVSRHYAIIIMIAWQDLTTDYI